MSDIETKRAIENALKAFAAKPMAESAISLLEALGYKSQKRLAPKPKTVRLFISPILLVTCVLVKNQAPRRL